MTKVLILLAICSVLYHHTVADSSSGNLFAANLFSVITKENPTKNVIYSPASIQTCIAYAFAGADGKTAEEMRRVLYLGEGDRQTVSQRYGEHLKTAFNNPKENAPILKMANRMFVNENIKIAKEFKEISERSFNAEAENINFDESEKATDQINNWVEQETENKIKNLLQPGVVDSDTSAVLVNAIYFKGEWDQPFSEHNTQKKIFRLNAEQEVQVDMMYQDSDLNYADLPEYNAKALELKYDNSDLSMLIILPNEIEGLAELESKLQGVDLNEIIAKMSEYEVTVRLPKFRIEFDITLNEPLKKMGLTTMFSNEANFSHMFESSTPQKVSDVVHKAFLEVNEAGSEAAAATYYKLIDYVFNTKMKYFEADHPFVFAIRSKTAVYFAGHVVNF